MSTKKQKNNVTIAEIATRAGVSSGAVSFALNGRKGISESTRARVLLIADELGWVPGVAAKSLTHKRSNSFGMVLARDPKNLGAEAFYMQFISGMESEMSARGYALLLQLAPNHDSELETIRKWRTSRRVDGVVLVDLHVKDCRAEYFRSHPEFPVVAVTGASDAAQGLMTVWTDDAEATRRAVRELARLGHKRIARIAGLRDLMHTQIRDDAFEAETTLLGCEGIVIHTDYSPDSGSEGTERALNSDLRPTAFIYDNDIMAVAALNLFSRLKIKVPEDVSVIAWDDSLICRYTSPPLTTLSHDVAAFGAHTAQRLFEILDGSQSAAHLDSVPWLEFRESIGAAPRS